MEQIGKHSKNRWNAFLDHQIIDNGFCHFNEYLQFRITNKEELRRIACYNILQENCTKTTSTIINKSEFRRRNQNIGENFKVYVSGLRKLAIKCNFTDIEDQIKEKFIEG